MNALFHRVSVLVPTEAIPPALVWPGIWGSVAQTGVPKNLFPSKNPDGPPKVVLAWRKELPTALREFPSVAV